LILSAKRVWPNMTTETLYVESSYTRTWYETRV